MRWSQSKIFLVLNINISSDGASVFIIFYTPVIYSDAMLQDIIGTDEIKLDFFFKASLTNDLVSVSVAISYLSIPPQPPVAI